MFFWKRMWKLKDASKAAMVLLGKQFIKEWVPYLLKNGDEWHPDKDESTPRWPESFMMWSIKLLCVVRQYRETDRYFIPKTKKNSIGIKGHVAMNLHSQGKDVHDWNNWWTVQLGFMSKQRNTGNSNRAESLNKPLYRAI